MQNLQNMFANLPNMSGMGNMMNLQNMFPNTFPNMENLSGPNASKLFSQENSEFNNPLNENLQINNKLMDQLNNVINSQKNRPYDQIPNHHNIPEMTQEQLFSNNYSQLKNQPIQNLIPNSQINTNMREKVLEAILNNQSLATGQTQIQTNEIDKSNESIKKQFTTNNDLEMEQFGISIKDIKDIINQTSNESIQGNNEGNINILANEDNKVNLNLKDQEANTDLNDNNIILEKNIAIETEMNVYNREHEQINEEISIQKDDEERK